MQVDFALQTCYIKCDSLYKSVYVWVDLHSIQLIFLT